MCAVMDGRMFTGGESGTADSIVELINLLNKMNCRSTAFSEIDSTIPDNSLQVRFTLYCDSQIYIS